MALGGVPKFPMILGSLVRQPFCWWKFWVQRAHDSEFCWVETITSSQVGDVESCWLMLNPKVGHLFHISWRFIRYCSYWRCLFVILIFWVGEWLMLLRILPDSSLECHFYELRLGNGLLQKHQTGQLLGPYDGPQTTGKPAKKHLGLVKNTWVWWNIIWITQTMWGVFYWCSRISNIS